MRQNKEFVHTIKKPSKPHRKVKKSDIPTEEEIKKRFEHIEKLKYLGISVNVLDNMGDKEVDYEEDVDKLQASILIMEDKKIPKELEQRILRNNQKNNKEIKALGE